jgi:RHS repeat-associated protein
MLFFSLAAKIAAAAKKKRPMHTTTQLSENSHQGFEGLKAHACLASMDAKLNTASGLQACLRREGAGSRCSGKERDETNLDYFGARYFSGALGRFTSVDPLMASAISDEPQTWNRYAYVTNNPLRFIDTDGKIKRDAEGKPIFVEFDIPVTVPHEGTGTLNTFQPVYLFADNGDKFVALRNMTDNQGFDTNCHGVTFADSMYWIPGDSVETILIGDGYKIYDDDNEGNPQKNDIEIFRGFDNRIQHSATITQVDKDGNVKQVWGIGGIKSYTELSSPERGLEGAYGYPGLKPEFYKKPPVKEKDEKIKHCSWIEGEFICI